MKTIINKQSGKVLFAIANFQDTDTEIAIDEILTEYFVVPYFNFETREFYEGATPEEIEQAFKDATPTEVQLWRVRTILKLMNLETTIESALDQLEEPTQTAAKKCMELWHNSRKILANCFIYSICYTND
jgi:hypothetical protein